MWRWPHLCPPKRSHGKNDERNDVNENASCLQDAADVSKLASEFVDSGSCVSLVSWTFFQLLGFSGALEVKKGRSLKTNSTSVPANRKAVFIFLREKFVAEFRAVFLMSMIDTLPCLLGLDFLTENDCILFAR